MAVLTDPNGTVWSINRRMWPFPGDALDLTFGLFEVLIGVLFALLWPFWLLAKFCGVRWVITVERNGHQVVESSCAGGAGRSGASTRSRRKWHPTAAPATW
ncbi:MAG: hypothetical protein ACXWEI_12815 [Mycobacterium sp.]